MNTAKRKEYSRKGGLVGVQTNADLLKDLFLILLRSNIWIEGQYIKNCIRTKLSDNKKAILGR